MDGWGILKSPFCTGNKTQFTKYTKTLKAIKNPKGILICLISLCN